jgi:hypothetical protein
MGYVVRTAADALGDVRGDREILAAHLERVDEHLDVLVA